MAKQTIFRGTLANDGTGDNLRLGANKINDNFKSNFKISNILDQDYEVNRNYSTPGISFFGGVESEF